MKVLELLFGSAQRLSYRRAVVLVVATWLFYEGRLSEPSWVLLALAFVGGELAQRLTHQIIARRPGAGA